MPTSPRNISLTGRKALRRAIASPNPIHGWVPAVPEAMSAGDLVLPQNPDAGVPAVYNHGGAVANGIPIVPVFWGGVWREPGINTLMQSLDAAARRLVAGVYFTGLREYGISPPVMGDTIIVTDPQPPQTYDSSDVEDVVNDLINDGTVPEPDEPGGRNLYIVFMPPGTTGPGGSTGAHDYFTSGNAITDVDHAWYGYVEYNDFNTMTRTFGHEVAEACTDPELDAWNADDGSEIGDVCNRRQGWVDGVWVEYYWSHQQVACILPIRVGGVSVIHPRSDEGAVSLYVIGSDGKVWSNFWPAGATSNWSGWFPIGDKTFPQEAPISVIHPRSDEGVVSLYVIGTDGQVWSNFWPAGATSNWSGWFPIGPNTFPQGAPISVIHPRSDEGAVSLYVIGTDGQVWSNFWPAGTTTNWSGWFPIGGKKFPLGATVSVVHPRSTEGAVSLYVISTDGQVWSNFWPAGTTTNWNGWFPIGPNTFPQGYPVSVIHPRSAEGAVGLYLMGLDGRVWSNFWPAGASTNWNGWFPIGDNIFPV